MPEKTYKFVLANERNIEVDMALLAAIKVIEFRDLDYVDRQRK